VLPLSIVIITRNEEINIAACIRSAKLITNDIIVVDCESYDNTISIAAEQGAQIISTSWKSFGYSRNLGAKAAKHDWIMALDADERITIDLALELTKVNLQSTISYRIKRKNYLRKKLIRFGTVGNDKPTRLYNRDNAHWDLSPIHEELICKSKERKTIHQGFVDHYAFESIEAYKKKLDSYAQLCVKKYLHKKKKATWVKRFLAPLFNAFKSYVLQLGFLDGINGWKLTKLIFFYTYKKYYYLHQLRLQKKQIFAELATIAKASA
jgi:glycosyltransferase involved in cell wall biosynthesis